MAVLGDATLRLIAHELGDAVRANVTIDWTVKKPCGPKCASWSAASCAGTANALSRLPAADFHSGDCMSSLWLPAQAILLAVRVFGRTRSQNAAPQFSHSVCGATRRWIRPQLRDFQSILFHAGASGAGACRGSSPLNGHMKEGRGGHSRTTTGRVIATIVALFMVVIWPAGLESLAFILMGLALVWFPDSPTVSLILSRGVPTSDSPPLALSILGWLFIIVMPVLMHFVISD